MISPAIAFWIPHLHVAKELKTKDYNLIYPILGCVFYILYFLPNIYSILVLVFGSLESISINESCVWFIENYMSNVPWFTTLLALAIILGNNQKHQRLIKEN